MHRTRPLPAHQDRSGPGPRSQAPEPLRLVEAAQAPAGRPLPALHADPRDWSSASVALSRLKVLTWRAKTSCCAWSSEQEHLGGFRLRIDRLLP